MNATNGRRLFSLVLAMLLVIAPAVHAGYSPADDIEPRISAEGALGDSPAKAICPFHRDRAASASCSAAWASLPRPAPAWRRLARWCPVRSGRENVPRTAERAKGRRIRRQDAGSSRTEA